MEASIGVNLRVTAHSNQGGRKYMEDMFCVAYQPTSDERDLLYAYFGIFDGHGGREAAAYAKQHLMDHIVSEKGFWSDDDEQVKKAIREGFMKTHQAMWKEVDKWPKTASGLPSTSGTTASIVFVRRGKMYIGHVGDSAIVLGIQDPESEVWRARALTRDHKPESAVEIERITQSGGKVVSKSGVPRVVWNRPRIGHRGPVRRSTHIDEIPFLAVARSLGDLWSYNSAQDKFVVSPEPDVSVIDIDVRNHRCIVLGSDGLWNMLSAQDAVNSVFFAEKNNERQLLSSPPDVTSSQVKNWINPSKRLVDRALERWMHLNLRADNTSVVTVVIDPPGPPKAQVLRQILNRAHVRSSGASVTDPTTSRTVPARVLDPIPGRKLSQCASAMNNGLSQVGRGFCTPVTSSTMPMVDSRTPVVSSASDRCRVTNAINPVVSIAKATERLRASSSNDTRTKRILVKRKKLERRKKEAHIPVDHHQRSSSESDTVSCSSPSCNVVTDSTQSPRQDANSSAESCLAEKVSSSKASSSASSAGVLSSKTNQDDVQIHEISSSSEGKIDKCPMSPVPNSETSEKRRKLTRKGSEQVWTTQRPLTRRSAILPSEDASDKTCTSDECSTPLSSRSKLFRRAAVASAATTISQKKKKIKSRKPLPKRLQQCRKLPQLSARCKSISPTFGEGGRSLRSCSKTSKRVTRSMKK